ncbi:ribulose-phosphate 3-epimerase [Entomoplasma freundtii]|uniref:Ribulose-phosphate 3-epimerase n=1 Tax=Entomoplasma freundtii TaxID=74700 RepID=A0A2K8NUG4_9MOLU|nr:ribulose-phosphate 3-epimerase [Entomoplasma freundtii]ATZ16263.1 ribulose-phosphate 3-epimerase [Entomoplasma freundtii]TDY56836.1 ribulose-phosphate 3-epimerase [Entomoplasma freundtii]
MKKPEIMPSILNANFLTLNQDLKTLKENGIKWIHYDVMDYDFVPNLTFGAKILGDILKKYDFKTDIHFMVKVKTKPFSAFFEDFIKLKPTMMTMHLEAMNPTETLEFIKLCHQNKIEASLAIKPQTPIVALEPYLGMVDNVLVMTVNPGFGGQAFLDDSAKKIGELKTLAKNHNWKYTVSVDGGINKDTLTIVNNEGVDKVVIGSYLFANPNGIGPTLEVIND